MLLLRWRKRKASGRSGKKKPAISNGEVMEIVIPNHFRCPISLDLMKDPVTLSSGITYDRDYIETWLEAGNFRCPVTNQVLKSFDQIPNHSLRIMIQEWCEENQRYGIPRLPTPHVPVTPVEISETLLSIKDSAQKADRLQCIELLKKLKKWGGESERNKRGIIQNGAAGVLSVAFDQFSSSDYSMEKNANVLGEILSLLNWMAPFRKETHENLGSQASLQSIIWFLSSHNISAKQNSILVLRELLPCDQTYVEALSSIEGVDQILVDLITNQISPTLTKSSLMVIFHIISSNEKMVSSFVEMGLISTLLELIIDSEKGISERALRVFDGICSCEMGREKAYENDLTIPVLVKKILRVSEMATESSVSAIWKLCVTERKDEGRRVVVEALQVGIFQKLLLVLQIGCGDETKEKATEIMKLLNPYRSQLECIDSLDFKHLKRSF